MTTDPSLPGAFSESQQQQEQQSASGPTLSQSDSKSSASNPDKNPTPLQQRQRTSSDPGVFVAAGNVLKQYLPESIASYLPGSEPQEKPKPKQKGKGPTGGVGSLPGTPNEEGVAKLPLERAQESLEKMLEEKALAAQSEVAPSMPSQEGKDEDLGKTSGVGALPGSKSEGGVAVLPQERSTTGGNPPTEMVHEFGPGRDELQEEGVILPSLYKPTARDRTAAPLAPTASGGAFLKSVYPPVKEDTTSNLSTIAEKGSETSSEFSREAPAPATGPRKALDDEIPAGLQPRKTGGSESSSSDVVYGFKSCEYPEGERQGGEGTRKVPFKDRLKGEAKILQGRISKNKEDIIEGERLKGKF